MLIKRHHISESYSFAAWQRLHDLGLGEEGIAVFRIMIENRLLSKVVDDGAFREKLVELGLAIIKVKVIHNFGQGLDHSIAIAGPPEAFSELAKWWLAQTGEECPIAQQLEWHHANSPLVKDRWQEAVEAGKFATVGAFSERGARL